MSIPRCLFLLIASSPFFANAAEAEPIPNKLLGDWSLELDTHDPAWLSITERQGKPCALMRIYVGSDGPYPIDEISAERITFSLKPRGRRGTNGGIVRRRVNVAHIDDVLQGEIVETREGDQPQQRIQFTGTRISPMPSSAPDLATIHFGHPIALLNGKDLSGWRPHEADKINGWRVEHGMLVNVTPKTDFSATGAHANLRTDAEFEDFWLHIEFLVDEARNSGIYLRGMYEAQVVDRDSRMQGINGPGAIFGKIAPLRNAGRPGGQWQTYDLTLVDRHITVVLNGDKVIDNQPINGPTAGAIYTNPDRPGPIYLQGDHTSVKYRNIYLAPVIKMK